MSKSPIHQLALETEKKRKDMNKETPMPPKRSKTIFRAVLPAFLALAAGIITLLILPHVSEATASQARPYEGLA